MGSSGEDPNNGIDPSVGGLVWVRRRNGSWWPGRILGVDELPEGCVPTPRSGTPVKLLGREDASVDWYNLEKSKRVKAFRCGDYDACIEKAKATASSLSKKAVKYARREDAIIHALELENARLGVDNQDFTTKANTPEMDQNPNEDSPSSSQKTRESKDFHENSTNSDDDDDSDSAPELSQSGVSFEEPNHLHAEKAKPKRWKTPNDSEDDGTEGVKRMKGLGDLGVGVESSLKRKRSQNPHVREFLKKKSRRRTLTKVLECSTKMESNESKKNISLVINNNSDSTCENAISLNAFKNGNDASLVSKSPDSECSEKLFDVPLVAEEKHSAGLSNVVSGQPQKTALSSQSSHVETTSLGIEEHNETGSTSSGTVDVHHIGPMLEKGASEWQLKGKRNSRSRTRAFGGPHIADVAPPHVADVAPSHRLLPYRQSRFTVNPKYDAADFSLRHHINPLSLHEVNVEVQTGQRAQRVPYISLMSKLNGKPVIGHPVAIEVLNDGFCDDILECYSSSSEFEAYERKKPCGRPPGQHYPLLKKSPKTKRNGVLSKKIRKLSSLTGSHNRQEDRKLVVDKLKGHSIACVPLNIVFSRINAALNRG